MKWHTAEMDNMQELTYGKQQQTLVAETGEQDLIGVELNYIPLINLAMHQNAIPLVYELILMNLSGFDMTRLECIFTSSSGFIQEKTITVDLLKPGEERPIHDLGLELNYQLLSSISEAMKFAGGHSSFSSKGLFS